MRAANKYEAINRNKNNYSIIELCKFFNVSRSGYYNYISKKDVEPKDVKLSELIRACQKKCGRTYGYRRVSIWLERQGIHKNPKTILKIMQKYNLLSQIRKPAYKRYGEKLYKYPNELNQNFKTVRPNEKWVTDISYIKTKEGFLYLSVIRDLYDNSIVSYKTDTNQSVNLVLETVHDAVHKERITEPLYLHSDQGGQYRSQQYNNALQLYHISPSMSSAGNPYDNALAENFFSTLKAECIHRVELQTFEEASLLIDRYIDFYNYERIQTKTKLTPFEQRCQFFTNL